MRHRVKYRSNDYKTSPNFLINYRNPATNADSLYLLSFITWLTYYLILVHNRVIGL
jgi:hypothetical protein